MIQSWRTLAALLILTPPPGFSDEPEAGTPSTPEIYGLTPEGKTLPPGIARFRLPLQRLEGSKAFDAHGKSSDSIVKYSGNAGAFVAEYGFSEKLSLQVKVQYVSGQSTTVNTSSSSYRDLKAATFAIATGGASSAAELSAAVRLQVIASFKAVSACPSDEACAAAYDAGQLVTQSEAAVLPGSRSVPAGTAYNVAVPKAATEIDDLVSEGIKAQGSSEGGNSLGDSEVGALYEVYADQSLMIAMAAGLRIPTGSRNLAATELTATRGTYELGARLNVDSLPLNWFMVSWQNQSEVGISGTTPKIGGVETKFSRRGLRNVGFLFLKPSLSVLTPHLSGLKTVLGVTYDYDAALIAKVEDTTMTSPRSQNTWTYAGIGYDLLNHEIPLRADLEYEAPLSGKNSQLALAKTTLTLKAFARF